MSQQEIPSLPQAAAELCHTLHKDRIAVLCKLLEGSSLGEISDWRTCLPAKGHGEDALQRLYDAAKAENVMPDVLRGVLFGASQAFNYVSNIEKTELIWTGPSTRLVPTRRTEQALLQLVNSATESLFITSFVAYKVGPVINALRAAIDRNVGVAFLLEESQFEGGTLDFDSIALMKEELLGADFFTWDTGSGEFSGGKVHAKVAVCDRSTCFISSANLTGHAMEKNMEAGVLIQGGSVPSQLQDHLYGLIDTGVISPHS